MSDPTDSFYQSSNGWLGLSAAALIALDAQFAALIAAGYKLDPNAPVPFTRAPF